MCGIAGVVSFGDFQVTPEYVTALREPLAHRGPDGAATWVSDDRRVGFGFRRLAIIDLSETAMQPMENEDGSVRLLMNGEIYNHAELRPELEQAGHRFRTDHSDTEVVVHAFEEWGIDCLHRLRGMFALAIWDERERRLWLVRDRVGIKPLYWSVHHGRLVFGSEVKALLADPEQPRAVDEEALYHYLSFLTTPAPSTMFAGIKKLPAAAWLRIDFDGTLQERRWWDPLDGGAIVQDRSDDELAGLVLDELRTSVAYRKVSDVPVGIFLSGGLDSSTNAALFAHGEERPVQTFSIGYDENYPSSPSELGWARRVAQLVGAEQHERILTQDDVLGFLPRMIEILDEPIADPVGIPIYYLSELARSRGVIVAQAGEGADELFCGYPSWRTHLRLERANALPVPKTVKRLGLAALRAAGQSTSRPHEFLRRGAEGLPVFWGGAEAFTETQKRRLLSARLRRDHATTTSWDALAPIRQRFEARAWERTPLNWMTYLDLSLRLPELLLLRIDKMSMAAGLEARVPFLDHKLVELAFAIPTAAKTRNGELKGLLKRAVRDLLPDEIIDRPKQGFRVPVDEWFLDRLGERTRSELDGFCRETDLLDRAEVERVLARPKRDAWYLLNLALWWRAHFAS
jgi:asparagine synthase (glutamine-hydrolysing)